MSTPGNEPDTNEAGIEELLREVGARVEPADDVKHAVHSAVHAEWQAMLDERRRRRRSLTFGIAASLALAVLTAMFSMRFMTPEPVQVATITRVDGRLMAGDEPRSSGEVVMSGETLRTDGRARAALTFGPGLSVRLDRNTSIDLVAPDRIVLNTGALYVDSVPAETTTALIVEALGSSVQHAGTQYEVRTQADSVLVSVREGRVVIDHAVGKSTAQAGEQIRVAPGGALTRTRISPQDPNWQWAATAAPTFDIDDQPLAIFLDWVARETGRTVVYSSAQAQRAARELKLRGSIIGLDPETALHAVLSTTQLRQVDTGAKFIGIDFASEAAPATANGPRN